MKKILNISNPKLYKNKKYNKIFDRLADILLNYVIININEKKFRLNEMEIYFNNNDHPDPFVHCNEDQKKKYIFYFHKTSNTNDTYKSGTFKGLDITFGEENEKFIQYGGILIRSIVDTKNKQIIDGPCNVVNYILNETKCKTIDELVNNKLSGNMSILNKQSILYLYTTRKLNKMKVYSGPRVGLTLKNMKNIKNREKYIMKNYRYILYPSVTKKYKPTLALKLLYKNKYNMDNTMKELKITKNKLEKYIDSFKKGKKMNFKYFHKKKLNIEDLCKLQGLCRLYYK